MSVIEGMNKWGATAVYWKLENITDESLLALLVEAEIIPAAATGKGEKFAYSEDYGHDFYMFLSSMGRYTFDAVTYDSGYDWKHDELFSALITLVQPAVELDNILEITDLTIADDNGRDFYEYLEEISKTDTVFIQNISRPGVDPVSQLFIPNASLTSFPGSRSILRFTFRARNYGFTLCPSGSRKDVWGVIDALNVFLKSIGRPQQIYFMEHPETWGSDGAYFICAHQEKFDRINHQLRLPFAERYFFRS